MRYDSNRGRNFTSKRALDDSFPPATIPAKNEPGPVKAPAGKSRLTAMFEAGVATAHQREFTKYRDMPPEPPPGSSPEVYQKHWQERERIQSLGPEVSTSASGTVRRTRERAVHNRVG